MSWKLFYVFILCLVEMALYMDRLAVASVLKDIQDYYDVNDSQGGLVQTVYFGFFFIFTPLFGYLGDRASRKWLLSVCISLWIGLVVASSLIPKNLWALFLVSRGLSGIGQSSCTVLAPTIIADLYSGTKRSMALMMFFFMIPIGSGLGFLSGSHIGSALGHWQWGIRFTAMLGVFIALLVIIFLREPRRQQENETTRRGQTFWQDCLKIVVVPTYILSTLGLTCVMFLTGSLEWWAPTLIEHGKASKLNLSKTEDLTDNEKDNITLVTGAITLVSGLFGVVMGSLIAHWLKIGKGPFRRLKTQSADAWVCTIGALICIPTMAVGFPLAKDHLAIAYVLFFIGITAACCNLAVVIDLQLSVIAPSRRNTANSWQTLVSSILGDATGPYIVGAISDGVRKGSTPSDHFDSLVKAFYFPVGVLGLATILFFASVLTTKRDLRKIELEQELEKSRPISTTNLDWSNSVSKQWE
ncbi:unnamed protein product, partial [Mesorhabditis belari]|uniref:Major facilitator superfamily (MFS) profile domain-containing protein n=1 Tax=Mesorhabditis belari TaxID=2138241 RepID=A0AAF3ELE7_9BILA